MKFQSSILAFVVAIGVSATALPGPAPMADGLVPISAKKLPSGSTALIYTDDGPVKRELTPIATKKLPSGSTAISYSDSGDVTQHPTSDEDLSKRGWWDSKPKYCHVNTTPECDDDNGGPNETCNELLNELQGDRSRKQPEGAKQYCIMSGTGKLCCVKWTKKVNGLTNGDIADRFEKATKTCTLNGISAKYNSFWTRDTCMSLCINDGAGCKDESVFKS
ncbi:unnamed protein product [Periconia digitata]|uniref:WD-like domain-containing protein n=1 Tax=Periconia digitata TaxID=1303443 RepID=A0A9W4XF41_9PLEO|nr:unnamed protein product [Periconia digitata]